LRHSLKPLNYALNLTLYTLYLAAFYRDRKQQSNRPVTEIQLVHPIKR
jgi:hypothetical protein